MPSIMRLNIELWIKESKRGNGVFYLPKSRIQLAYCGAVDAGH